MTRLSRVQWDLSAMQMFIDQLMAADWYAWRVITLMAFLFTVFVTSAIGNYLYSVVFYPGFVAGGLVANWYVRNSDIFLVPDRKISVIIESALGMALSLVIILIVTRMFMGLYGMTIRPPVQGTRTRAIVPR